MADPAYFTRYSEDGLTTRVEAHNLGPEQKFSVEWLDRASADSALLGYPYVEWDGQRIVLNLSNGRWVYTVAAREDYGRIVVGRWPD